jgi:hypothetical protein
VAVVLPVDLVEVLPEAEVSEADLVAADSPVEDLGEIGSF